MGVEVNYSWYVARLREEGTFHTASENLPVELAEFRRELRRPMKAAGLRLQTSNRGGLFIASDPDYEVPDEKLRAVMEAMAEDMCRRFHRSALRAAASRSGQARPGAARSAASL